MSENNLYLETIKDMVNTIRTMSDKIQAQQDEIDTLKRNYILLERRLRAIEIYH